MVSAIVHIKVAIISIILPINIQYFFRMFNEEDIVIIVEVILYRKGVMIFKIL